MAESVGVIYYEVEADTAKLVNGGHQVDGSLGKMQAQFSKTDKAASATQFQMTKTASAVQELGRQAQAAQSPLGGMGKLLGGLLTLQGANSLIQMAEGYGEMAERVRMATSSVEEYEMVQARLLDTANGTYRSMKEAQELYILTGDTLRSMGYSTEQTLDVVDSLSYAFVKNATSQERAQSAISAFTNSMMKGKVEADSWSSIIAAVPSVINDLAASTGKTAAEIRELGASGKIAASMLSGGLLNSLNENKAAADGMATTVKDAFTQLRNNLAMYVGEANMANGATGLLSKSIMLFGQNIDTVVNLLMTLGAGALAKYVVTMGAATVASGRAMIAARAEAAAELDKARALVASTAAAAANATAMTHLGGSNAAATAAVTAHTAAQRGLAAAQATATTAGVGLTAILGGPAGIIALVASAAAGVLLFGTNAAASAPDVDKLTESIEKLNATALQNRIDSAGDAITLLKKDAEVASSAVSGLKKDYDALNKARAKGSNISEQEIKNVERTMREQQEASDKSIANLQAAYNAEKKLLEVQEQRAKSGAGPVNSVAKSDPEVQKRLAAMREELELAKLTGEARARLQALQKLGANATAEERAEAEKLAAQIYNIENSRKQGASAQKEAVKDMEKQAKTASDYLNNLVRQSLEVKNMTAQDKLRQDIADGTVVLLGKQLELAQATAVAIDSRENMVSFQKMGEAIAQAALHGEELAKAKARANLNSFATPEEIALMEQMAVQAERLANAQSADPMLNAKQKYEQELQALKTATEMKLIEDQRYLELKTALERDYEDQKRAAQEETFRKQSEANNLLMNSIDLLGQHGTSAVMGMLQGTTPLGEAMRGLGSAILNEVVKSFVQMGISYVKSLIMGKTAEAAATAASIAAAATTAVAWAPAAAMVSLASFGANAAPAAAGITSTAALAQGLSIAGGRQYGGPVSPGKMYRINETGAPEVLNMANGQQFMLPNSRGEVVSNKDAAAAACGGAAPHITVNLIEDGSRGGQVEQEQVNDQHILNVFVNSIRRGTDAAQAVEGTYGVSRRGR